MHTQLLGGAKRAPAVQRWSCMPQRHAACAKNTQHVYMVLGVDGNKPPAVTRVFFSSRNTTRLESNGSAEILSLQARGLAQPMPLLPTRPYTLQQAHFKQHKGHRKQVFIDGDTNLTSVCWQAIRQDSPTTPSAPPNSSPTRMHQTGTSPRGCLLEAQL